MKGFINGVIDGSVFICFADKLNLYEISEQLLIALGIVLIHIIIQPFLEWLFKRLKQLIKSKQKTIENDGEIADKLLDITNDLEQNINNKIEDFKKKGEK